MSLQIQQKRVSNIGVILETRIGLKTIEREKITARGVKPIGLVQGNFKAYYLYGWLHLKPEKISGCSFHILTVNLFKYS